MAQLKVKQVVNLIESFKVETYHSNTDETNLRIKNNNALLSKMATKFTSLGDKIDRLEDIRAETLLLERELFTDFSKSTK